MVVEGIGLHVEDILVSLVLSINISWTFRILAHEDNQYSYVYKILGHFLSKALKETESGPQEFRNYFSSVQIEFCLVLFRFSVFYVQKSECYFS